MYAEWRRDYVFQSSCEIAIPKQCLHLEATYAPVLNGRDRHNCAFVGEVRHVRRRRIWMEWREERKQSREKVQDSRF